MRIGRWVADGRIEEGFLDGHEVVSFPERMTVATALGDGLPALSKLRVDAEAGRRRALDSVIVIAPLKPAAIRDFVAFEEHVEGVTAGVEGKSQVVPEWYEAPTFYFTNPHTVLGPDSPVPPPATERLDFELEVAAIVGGTGGSNLSPTDAEHAIFGYTIMHDWSARDLQAREMKVRLGPAKGKDFATSLGPWIVTADELEVFRDVDGMLAVRAEAYVNDRLVGEDLVSNMAWSFPELLAYASRNSRIIPGDVLGSGTVGNGGCLAELWGRAGELLPPPLREGDRVRLVVEGLGELRSTVGATVLAPTIRAARTGRTRHRFRDNGGSA